MLNLQDPRIAVVGAGMAGSACAAGLRRAGVDVTVFDKSPDLGGRMATRRVSVPGPDGATQTVAFDHGAHGFAATRPRFRRVLARAVAAGQAAAWQPVVHTTGLRGSGPCHVATPSMPALCRHILDGATVSVDSAVRRLQRAVDGRWSLAIEGAALAGPFDGVVVAVPPVQAALLVAGHRDDWAEALAARPMEPCWTLMAVTDDVDWPWDAAELDHGPLAWLLRNDRVPGRTAAPGRAVWTAHASAEWSAAHLDDEPEAVLGALRQALADALPAIGTARHAVRWHHAAVHRWRHANPVAACNDGGEFWWDAELGVGVCGDSFGGDGDVEAAWHSGDELADHMAAAFDPIESPPRPVPASV